MVATVYVYIYTYIMVNTVSLQQSCGRRLSAHSSEGELYFNSCVAEDCLFIEGAQPPLTVAEEYPDISNGLRTMAIH